VSTHLLTGLQIRTEKRGGKTTSMRQRVVPRDLDTLAHFEP
jgi:hypothetical protein